MLSHTVTKSSLWKLFGVKDDQVMLRHIKALGKSMGGVKPTPLLVKKMGRLHEGNYLDEAGGYDEGNLVGTPQRSNGLSTTTETSG